MASFRPDPRTLLSGVLYVLSFPPWDITPLAWVCLIPFFSAIERTRSLKSALVQGVWMSWFVTIGGFSWVAYAVTNYGNLPWILSILVLILYGLVAQAQFILLAGWRSAGKSLIENAESTAFRNRVVLLLAGALLYAGVDWLLPKLFVDTFGHAFYRSPHLRQVADLGGAPLLTFLAFIHNDALWKLWKERRPHALFAYGVVFALCGAAWLYGSMRLEQVREWQARSAPETHFGVIQANVGDLEKLASESGLDASADEVVNSYLRLSDEALSRTPRPDFIVWPETAYPTGFLAPRTTRELARDKRVIEYARTRAVSMLFGTYHERYGRDHNSLFYLPHTANEQHTQVYLKNILLPFGEFIPGMDTFSWIATQFPQVGNFGRGPGPTVLTVESAGGTTIRISPIICYEALFPNYAIEGARKGSQAILNITNDSWFGPFGEPELHLSLTVFRSIETRLPQIRSTNTGISALILPDGEITQASGKGEKLSIPMSVKLHPPLPTLMMLWGDWFAPFAVLASMGLYLSVGPVRTRLFRFRPQRTPASRAGSSGRD